MLLLFRDFTGVDNGDLVFVLDLTILVTNNLDRLDHLERLVVSHLAENDVFAIEPASDDGSDEELRSVAARWDTHVSILVNYYRQECRMISRVGTGVGHGEQARLRVLQLEVLIGELLAVDGLAARALSQLASLRIDVLFSILTLPRVKSPPWSMKSGMTRWKAEPL